MLDSNVLVLNRSYLPIHVTSVRRAFTLIYRDVARAVDEEYQTFDFEQWHRVDGEPAIGTAKGPIRVPRVILLVTYDRIPKRQIRYSRVNIFTRDKHTCQYCGARPPRSNRRKGGRTPQQARLRLRRKPSRPRWTPMVNLAISHSRHEEWQPFLGIVDTTQRAAASTG
jgi:hypothetical protein